MSYAVIRVGGKQYRVQEGERLLVDRLTTEEGKTFSPEILFLGGDGKADFGGDGSSVTARVLGHVKGEKIRIGKYRPKNGFKKHTGFRASLTQIQIESIGAAGRAAARKAEAAPAPKAEAAPAPKAEAAPAPKAEAAPEPKAAEATAAPTRQAHPPQGYEEMTVAQIGEDAASWRRPNLEAALEHERANANRKGAIAALESALAAKEEEH
jgi:large subunit ribosomal protein L21